MFILIRKQRNQYFECGDNCSDVIPDAFDGYE